MSVVSVQARSFILALFIRDDGERFLLGDNGYDFKDSQLHFAANTIENDEVAKQGTDGTMLAGQVRRSSVQDFEGYVGDAADPKVKIEQMRRDFIGFFAVGYHFRVIYVDCNRNAWQRKGGYIVDAPEVKELWQLHPEYHVGLNFEDVNYYSYEENEDGEEILANVLNVPISTDVSGGLEWDMLGAVSEPAVIEYDTETTTVSGTNISVSDAVAAPLFSFSISGDTAQDGTPTPSAPVAVQTVTGENVVKICGKNLFDKNSISTGYLNADGTLSSDSAYKTSDYMPVLANTAYYKTLTQSPRTKFFDSSKNPLNTTTYQDISIGGSAGTFTTPNNAAYLRISYPVSGGTPVNPDTIQIELGSTATTYEPYQGQSYEVNLASKNLFDPSAALDNHWMSASGVISTSADPNVVSGYIRVKNGSTYTVSGMPGTFNIRVCSFTSMNASGFKTTLINYTTNRTFTANADYVVIAIGGGDAVSAKAGFQLEEGSTSTAFEAFWQIELCKIGDYQDYIYKSGEKWYVHKTTGKAELGTVTWTNQSWGYQANTGISNIVVPANSNTIATGIGTCFIPITMNNAYGLTGSYDSGLSISTSGKLMARATSITDLATFNTAMAGQSFYYALATPTDTEITNEALIEQLEAVLAGFTYAGANNITTIISAGNARSELEITYYTKYNVEVVSGGYVWEEGGEGGPTTVINNSITNVLLTWTVYGPATNPTLENTTTGEALEYVGTVADGQTLVIDMGEQTATLDGTNVISNITGDYVSVAPGTNILTFSAIGDTGPSKIGWSEIVG